MGGEGEGNEGGGWRVGNLFMQARGRESRRDILQARHGSMGKGNGKVVIGSFGVAYDWMLGNREPTSCFARSSISFSLFINPSLFNSVKVLSILFSFLVYPMRNGKNSCVEVR